MTTIIVEFATPNAKKLAREWRRSIIKKIEEALLAVGNPGVSGHRLFKEKEFSVYMTFKEVKKA